MHLIDIYIQEVTRKLPEKSRDDIALELRSTIEDMLPENYAEKEVKEVLGNLGNPASLASEYSDRPMYLIGPRYFDTYMTLLKIVIPIVAILAFLVIVVENVISYSGEEDIVNGIINVIILILGHGIWGMFSAAMETFFWITLVFAILERKDTSKSKSPLTPGWTEWTPDDLKSISLISKEKKISTGDIFGHLLWIAIFISVYFNAGHLLGVYEKVQGKIELITPTFNQEVLHSYWLIVIVALIIEIAFVFYKLILRQWTSKLAIMNTVRNIVSTIVFIIVISNDQLINEEFYMYLEDLLQLSFELKNVFIIILIVLWLFLSILDIVQGFRKANTK